MPFLPDRVPADAVLLLLAAMAAWAALAVVAWLRARRWQAQAEAADRLAAERGALLDGASERWLHLRPDGSVDAPLQAWRALGTVPVADWPTLLQRLEISAEDTARLAAAVEQARATGLSATLPLGFAESQRPLRVRIDPAPATLDGVLLWVHDASALQQALEQLEARGEQAQQAFDALARLIDAAPVPMWHRGPNLHLRFVNRAYVEAVDAADANQVIERSMELVETSAGQPGPVAIAAEAQRSGKSQWRIVPTTIQGQRRSLRVVDVPLGDAGVAGFAIDNDELDRARSEFRRFVSSQRDTLDRLSSGVAQFTSEGTLNFWNQAFERTFALRPEWLADEPEFERVLERMREAGRAPEVRDFVTWKRERRGWFTNPDGASEESWQLPGGAHLRVLAQPLPDGGLLAIFEDRTEQVQLASARDTLLRVREATFNNLFEAVGVFAADGRLHNWNTRFREIWALDQAYLETHPSIDELARMATPMFVNPQRVQMLRQVVREATIDRRGRTGRVTLRNGRHYEFATVPLPDGNALLTMLDVSDSRRVERVLRDRAEALEAADRVKTAFVANMSHELRTPLTTISGFGQMLGEGYAGELPDRAVQYIGAINEASATLARLVDDVLAMTKMQAGLFDADSARIDLRPMLEELVRQRLAAARAAGIELVADLATDIAPIKGDANALRGAIGAVIDAAMSEGNQARRVIVFAREGLEGPTVVVSDDGAGKKGARPEVEGLQRIVKATGGEINVFTERWNGSAIHLDLNR